ncbi:hypothetical protein [Micromonospora sp. U21]|uniref:hypothetical protein n=1 Tax=Micromonospora sp. U21 TaxID=2824899 RepID=UPI001B36E325|nr:hypothetical protein [Micromonospora sp. U21]MBQ0906095.1 hypothetical protein [Micromonospora sp. U21]
MWFQVDVSQSDQKEPVHNRVAVVVQLDDLLLQLRVDETTPQGFVVDRLLSEPCPAGHLLHVHVEIVRVTGDLLIEDDRDSQEAAVRP